MNRTLFLGVGVAALIAGGLLAQKALAQPANDAQRGGLADPNYGTLHLQSNLGSFKMLNGKGRVTINFTGTLLLSGIEGGAPVLSGNLKKEYENPERKRTVLTGTGSVTVQGSWRGIQWFGRNMTAVFYGSGVTRLDGEFDRNLETGWYWYDDPADRTPWPSEATMDVLNPAPRRTPGTGEAPREIPES